MATPSAGPRKERTSASAFRLELRAAGVALQREPDELVDQLGIRQPGRLPQLRIHRDRREAGNRVELVHEEPPSTLLEEEVDARHAVDPERAICVDGDPANGFGVDVGEWRGHEQLGCTVDVLVVEVVEVMTWNDLTGQ